MNNIGKIIEAELRNQKRSATWLAKELYCDRTNIYSIFKRESLDTKLLLRISVLLKYDFFKLYTKEYRAELKQAHQK